MNFKKLLACSLLLGMVVTANAAEHAAKTEMAVPSTSAAKMAEEQSVNINQADQKALEAVTGIGPKKAKAIIDYRTQNGDFKSVNDLTKIKGIGQKWIARYGKNLTV